MTATPGAVRGIRLPQALHRSGTRPRVLVWSCAIVLAVIVVASVLAPWIAPYEPLALSREMVEGPSSGHWLGTDDLGRDVLSHIIHGGRVSLVVGVAAGLGSLVIGTIVGAVSGYFGGWVDTALMRFTEIFQVMPTLIIALVIVAVLGRGAGYTSVAVVVAVWPQAARVLRSQFLQLRESEFVEASRIAGMRWYEVAFRVILPVAIPPLVVQATLDLGRGILLEAGLSFLGLGDPSAPSWGAMLRRAQPYLDEAWWLSIPAGLAIFAAVFCVNILGDALNDRINPTGTGR